MCSDNTASSNCMCTNLNEKKKNDNIHKSEAQDSDDQTNIINYKVTANIKLYRISYCLKIDLPKNLIIYVKTVCKNEKINMLNGRLG